MDPEVVHNVEQLRRDAMDAAGPLLPYRIQQNHPLAVLLG